MHLCKKYSKEGRKEGKFLVDMLRMKSDQSIHNYADNCVGWYFWYRKPEKSYPKIYTSIVFRDRLLSYRCFCKYISNYNKVYNLMRDVIHPSFSINSLYFAVVDI